MRSHRAPPWIGTFGLMAAVAVLALVAQPAAWAQTPAGVTAAVNPQATGTAPAELPRVLEIGADVVQNEHITTGPEGQAQLLFRDGSTMTLGPNGDLTIDNFVYNPEAKTARLAMTAATGLFRFVGGSASKDEPVVLNTPTATIGIRGGINFTTIGANGETETSQAYGKDTTATSKSTGEQATLTKNGFTMSIKANQSIATAPTDPARIAGFLTSLKGRSGATGGASSSPNQNSQQAQKVASANSDQAPGSFIPGTFGNTTNTLSSIGTFTNQLVSTSAQTTTIASTTSGGVPIFPSGSYSGGILTPLLLNSTVTQITGSNVPGGAGGVPYPTFSYFDPSGNQTVTRSASNAVTLVNGIPQSFSTFESFTGVSGGNTFPSSNQLMASIASTTVSERGGDTIIQFGRLTGGTGTLSGSCTNCNGSQGSNQSFGPFTGTLNANQSSHYLIGVPATLLPAQGTFNFSLFGATSPTFADGHGSSGSFTGSMNITFGVNPASVNNGAAAGNISGLVVALDATVTMPGDASYHFVTTGGLSNPAAQIQNGMMAGSNIGTIGGLIQRGSFQGLLFVTPSGLSQACPSGSSCVVALVGALAGPGGIRAGILYTLGNFSAQNLSQLIMGVAAFKR